MLLVPALLPDLSRADNMSVVRSDKSQLEGFFHACVVNIYDTRVDCAGIICRGVLFRKKGMVPFMSYRTYGLVVQQGFRSRTEEVGNEMQ